MQYCLIETRCSTKIVLRDSFSNIVTVPNVLGNDDTDIVMIGNQGTLYITKIDASESDKGFYYIYY